MPADIEETGRNADIRSPVRGEYNPLEVRALVFGRESAICEACQRVGKHPAGGDLEAGDPLLLRHLVPNVFTVENTVLICHSCANRPPEEWRAAVRQKRARERDWEPTLLDHGLHWLSDPRSRSLFARRTSALLAGSVAAILVVSLITAVVGFLLAGTATGLAWGDTILEGAITGAAFLVGHPWPLGGLVALGYTAHARERLVYDPRGHQTRERRPWKLLLAGGITAGVGALGHLTVADMGLLPRLGAILIWGIGAAGVAAYIDLSIRRDRTVEIWYPNRGRWLFAGRLGLLPGLLAITVGLPFGELFTDAAAGLLAAIPAAVALAYNGARLPYDTQTRDRILALLPERSWGWRE